MSRGRDLNAGRYSFAAVEVGDRVQTGLVTVTGEAIDRFADLSGDRFAIHMDDDAARAKGFPGRVAHGLLVLSLVDGLKNQAPAQFDAIASLGWDWTFSAPVFIGDVLEVEITVLEKIESRSNPARGILRLGFVVTDQNGDTVQRGTNKLMVHC
ncbi:MaoC family dehydratase [Shimia abyssi]|uniref:Acyl dehydratase n=1 Tax=Shimia abyssi TaxID=1662395 RepID=A0A2P8F674_9RHOB|nr:MaoC family dehydratase [Shimia abyssi]PSL17216.1 acyl dehydratase [Shimia abyssi]